MRSWVAVCAVGAVGCGGMHSSKEAPFDLNPRSTLWVPVEGGDEASFSAMIVLADEKLDCSVVAGKGYEEALQGVIAKGQGALLVLYAFAAQGSVPGDPTGVWTEAGASALEEPYAQARSMETGGWSEGFLFDAYGGDGWLELDEVGDKVTGEFRTQWWWGPIKAEPCGAIDGLVTTTSTFTTTSSR